MRMDACSALVSGGASGLGLATVHRLVAAGAHVVILDHAPALPIEDADALGDRARLVQADVTDEVAVAEAVATASALGPLAATVSCAGVATASRVLGQDGLPTELSAYRHVLDVNLVGTFNLVRLSAAAMARNDPQAGERGVVIMTASVAAFDGQVGQAAYSASKAGVAGMTLPLARDLASIGVRVMTIAPGLFATPMVNGLPAPVRHSLERQVPHPTRAGKPEEFAMLVGHIIRNPMLNGEVIRLDGAMRMGPR